MNLIINGAEAISQPSGTVTVTTERCDVANSKLQSWGFIEEGPAPGAYVVLTLQDDGDAVSEATRARSFDPFLTTKKHGRGLIPIA